MSTQITHLLTYGRSAQIFGLSSRTKTTLPMNRDESAKCANAHASVSLPETDFVLPCR